MDQIFNMVIDEVGELGKKGEGRAERRKEVLEVEVAVEGPVTDHERSLWW